MNKKFLNRNLRGFTLIELLIVIAILGTLAVVVLLALNPVQQLARTRDAGRQSTVTQLGHAIEAYATGNDGKYPAVSGWSATLVSAGEIATVPGAVSYTAGPTACGTNVVNSTWCYNYTAGTGAIVFAKMEAQANLSKCPTTATTAWFVYSTAAGRGGGVCTNGAVPAVGLTSFDF